MDQDELNRVKLYQWAEDAERRLKSLEAKVFPKPMVESVETTTQESVVETTEAPVSEETTVAPVVEAPAESTNAPDPIVATN